MHVQQAGEGTAGVDASCGVEAQDGEPGKGRPYLVARGGMDQAGEEDEGACIGVKAARGIRGLGQGGVGAEALTEVLWLDAASHECAGETEDLAGMA